MTKGQARQIIQSMGLPAAQLEAARRTLRRATQSEDVEVTRMGSGDLIVKRARPGKVGYQVLEDRIRPDGGKDVVQKAYDDAGNLVHDDPKGGRP